MTELIQRYGLTKAVASRLLGIPIRTLEDWCAGRREPPEYLLKLIEFYLDKTIPNK